jgi:O-methyltransferase domain
MALTAADRPAQAGTGAAETLLDLIASACLSQAFAVAAELHIADWLAQRAMSAEELAGRVPCHTPSLRRLLLALVAGGACTERGDGAFLLTPLGDLLRARQQQASLHHWSVWWGRYRWPAWGQLAHSVRTGQCAIGVGAASVGMERLDEAPGAAAVFNSAMTELNRFVAHGVVQTCDLAGNEHVVDVGGGHGELLVRLLQAHEHLRGTLLDRAHARAGALAHLTQCGVAQRCEVMVGDFFVHVPSGGDVYVLMRVLHDWDDERCAAILRNCREAMCLGSRLLVIEQLTPLREASAPSVRVAAADLNMLVMIGGRERSLAEYEALLDAAALTVTGSASVSLGYSVVQAVAV